MIEGQGLVSNRSLVIPLGTCKVWGNLCMFCLVLLFLCHLWGHVTILVLRAYGGLDRHSFI